MPSKESANAYRLLSLVVDEGTGSLRHLFDSNIPQDELQNKLNESAIRTTLGDLRNKKVISKKQWETLYPQIGKPRAKDFDITLLNVLLRYACGLDDHSRLWTVGHPSSHDTSTEADISRIRLWRNKFAHMKELALSENEFENGWQELEQAILRLGSGIPELAERIKLLKERTIDHEYELRYTEELLSIRGDLRSLKDDLDGTEAKVSALQANVKNVDKRVDENSKKIDLLMNKMTTTKSESEAQNKRNKQEQEDYYCALSKKCPHDCKEDCFYPASYNCALSKKGPQDCKVRIIVRKRYWRRAYSLPPPLGFFPGLRYESRDSFDVGYQADVYRSSIPQTRLNEGRSYIAVVMFDDGNVPENLASRPKRPIRNEKQKLQVLLYENGTKIKEAKLTQSEVNKLFKAHTHVVWELPSGARGYFEYAAKRRMLGRGFIT